MEVAGDLGAVPRDDTVQCEHLAGLKEREGVLEVTSADRSYAIFNDVLLNYPPTGGLIGYFLAPTGRPSVPRFARWMFISDRRAFGEHLKRLAVPELDTILFGHGANVTARASEVLAGLADTV